MSAASQTISSDPRQAPPYPAAVTIAGPGWRSALARDGVVPLARPVIQIGRLEGNDIVLNDPAASRHHAAIRWVNHGYEIEDLGATYGVYVQGQRVASRMLLTPGSLIRIGNTELLFNILGANNFVPPTDAQSAIQAPPNALPAAPRPALPARPTQGGLPPQQPVAPPQPQPAPPPMGQMSGGAAYAVATQHYYDLLAHPHESALARFFKTQARKQYWRIFLLGLLAYILSALALTLTSNLHIAPLVLLLASALVPITFVVFLWEQNALADMPLSVVAITFASGATVGLLIAAFLEPILIPVPTTSGISLGIALLIGLIEETAKIVCVLWFLRNARLRTELDGLILGAAAGMGFAALETAGYGFVAFLSGFFRVAISGNATQASAIAAGATAMNVQLLLRMALAIFGHGVWTAILAATIWRERGNRLFRLTPGVLLAFGLAVGLHALWDWAPITALLPPSGDPLTNFLLIIIWFLLVGALGIFFLRFFLRESLRRAKLGPLAPPPPPLPQAIITDTLHPNAGQPQPYGYPQSYPAPAQPIAYIGPSFSAPGQQPGQIGQAQAIVAPPPPRPNGPQPLPPGQVPGVNSTYCPRCNLTYPAGAHTCVNCGGPLIQGR